MSADDEHAAFDHRPCDAPRNRGLDLLGKVGEGHVAAKHQVEGAGRRLAPDILLEETDARAPFGCQRVAFVHNRERALPPGFGQLA